MDTQFPAGTGHSLPKSQSWMRLAGIVAIYALLGPLTGAVGVNVFLTVHAVAVEIVIGNFEDIARLFWGGIVVGTIVSVIIAYSIGIAPALGVGLVVAFGDRRKGAISWRASLVGALVFWLLSSAVVIVVVPPEGLMQWIGALLVAHVLAAAVCASIARLLFMPVRSSHDTRG